jgi:hypothetical protein
MSAKQRKSASELRSITLNEIQQHGDCRIIDIAIYRPAQVSEYHPNWDVAFTMNGYPSAPEPVFRLVRQLQSQFECDWL